MNRPEGFDIPEPKTAASVIVADLNMTDVTREPRSFSGSFVLLVMAAEVVVLAPFIIVAVVSYITR